MYRLLRPLLFSLPPELAHQLTLGGLRAAGPVARWAAARWLGLPESSLAREVAGLRLAGPVGLAAGLDKDGALAPFWPLLGFGFIELGTVTRSPQPGNPRPRLFRFPREGALVNRMGFNNQGVEALVARLSRWRAAGALPPVPVGVNLGKSKITPLEEAAAEYAWSASRAAPVADYLVINVSSPNTPGLRGLQDAPALSSLVRGVVAAAGGKPVLVKLAPDLEEGALVEAVAVSEDAGAAGFLATNTTIARYGLPAVGPGGLSGRPLFSRALEVVRRVAARARRPVIGCGGVASTEDARAMLDAGAQAVQLYSALIFEGPGLVRRINHGLSSSAGPGPGR